MKELRIAVVGDGAVEAEARNLNGKIVRGLRVRIVKVTNPAQLKEMGVSMLYLGSGCGSPQEWRDKAPAQGIFIVDSSSPESDLKSDARFVQVGNHLRFDLNVDEIRRHDLKISPRLVKVASRLYSAFRQSSRS